MNFHKAKIILTNDFHDTEINILARIPAGSDQVLITRSQVQRARRVLCGVKGCTCGDVAGCRPQIVDDSYSDVFQVRVTPENVLPGFYKSCGYDASGMLFKQ